MVKWKMMMLRNSVPLAIGKLALSPAVAKQQGLLSLLASIPEGYPLFYPHKDEDSVLPELALQFPVYFDQSGNINLWFTIDGTMYKIRRVELFLLSSTWS